jgi:hypothetical protein
MNWHEYEEMKRELLENSLFEESEPNEYEEEIKRLVEEMGL